MSNLKVEGKVADFCPKCKNCKSTTRGCDGKKDWLTEVECEDPYDGMIKTLAADSDICCSMFTPKPDRACGKCERFDGTYCHGPNNTITISYKALFGEPVDCPSFEEKKEKEPCDTISLLQHELEMDKLRKEIHELEKEKAAHMKGIERLKKANNNLLEKCNGYIAENAELKLKIENTKGFDTLISNLSKQIQDLKIDNVRLDRLYSERDRELNGLIKASKRKDDLIQSYRKKLKKADDEINLLNSKVDKLGEYYRTDEKLIDNIQKVIFPQEEGSDYAYSYDEILNKVKDLKVQSDENGTMYEDLKHWKERCHNAESDVTTLTSEVGTLNNMYNRLKDKNDKEIENLKEKNEELKMMVERRDMWVNDLQIDVNTLQNEILTIRNIAQKAYDDTNRD